jgi:molybdopterin converting factor small subunit
MSVEINIPWFLQSATGGVKTAEVSGRSVGDCLRGLAERFPLIREEIFNQADELSPFIDIHLDGRSVRREGLDRAVKAGDKLAILLVVDGG